MNTKTLRIALLAIAAATIGVAARAADPPPPPNEQVVVPEVDRRGIRLPRFPTSDFEIGVLGGTYSTQNFGTSFVGGLRLGYHITEDFFVEGIYGLTNVTDKDFRLVLPGGIFPNREGKAHLLQHLGRLQRPAGRDLPRQRARLSFAVLPHRRRRQHQARHATQAHIQLRRRLSRLFLRYAAIQIDVRDHVFSLDLLGQRQSTQNLELTLGLTGYF